MTLYQWRIANKLSQSAAARWFGLPHATSIRRYERGEQIPRPARMDLFYKLSGGAIKPADWYREKAA